MPADPNRVETLFHRALGLPAADRPAFLAAACGDDAELRGRVERLLAAADSLGEPATSALPADPPTATFGDPVATADHAPQPDVGTVLGGKYKLVEEIGEGGMGSVWMAQQTEPVKRAVAVKVIKAGMDSKAVLARFEAERQALAMMDHPNIARVLDAGAAPDGRPFFVMELVKGDPITKFCDARKLTPKQRLELFVPVCQAIQHAHMKGVIHRDIKPTNVLVAMYDDKPVPKVIDFGVAKAAGQTLTDKTLMTGFGAVVGTPEYMSPEQANLNNLDIDTRSDVYSLGVLLYELLTGTTPVDRQSLGKAALLEVLRIVREVEAPRPSGKLSSAATPPSVAANRGTEPAKLSKLMKGELDWVLLKALEKDRTRRYDTANGLARDIQRYLADEVVEARPPSAGYRVRKFVRRHKARVAATAAFLALLLAAVGVSSWLAVKARNAEVAAENRREEADENAEKAKASAAAEQKMYWKAIDLVHEAWTAKGKIEHFARSLQVDLDLAEVRTDPRLGILRLVKTLRSQPEQTEFTFPNGDTFKGIKFPPEQIDLDKFVTVAVLAKGQEYAPLLPPITHDGGELIDWHLALTGRRLISLGRDGTVRLWDAATAKLIAVLRRADELVFNCGLSPDGKTAYTDGLDGVVRLWETSDGAYRAETEPRPAHVCGGSGIIFRGGGGYRGARGCWYSGRDVTHISNDRLLTRSVPKLDAPKFAFTGPVELWDTTTGRRISVLDTKSRSVETFRFTEDGRWISAACGPLTTSIFNAQDGRHVAELKHEPDHVAGGDLYSSPDGESFATVGRTIPNGLGPGESYVYHWTPGTWQSSGKTGPCPGRRWLGDEYLRFLNLDGRTFAFNRTLGDGFESPSAPLSIYRVGDNVPRYENPERTVLVQTPDGSRVLLDDGAVVSTRTWQRATAPAGRRYATDVVSFAADKRFVWVGDVFIDSRTEKEFVTNLRWAFHAGFGWIADASVREARIRRLPPPEQFDLPPALLQLWAQVAVRGELGPDGAFVKWDEAAWEKKRQELAAVPPPHPDFPFPGHVATDKLHWLRAEHEAAADKDKPRLVAELLRRAEAGGDKAEAVRWRAEWDRLNPEAAPPPRAKP